MVDFLFEQGNLLEQSCLLFKVRLTQVIGFCKQLIDLAVLKLEQPPEPFHLQREPFRVVVLEGLKLVNLIVEQRLKPARHIDQLLVLMLGILQMFIPQLAQILLQPFNLIVFLNSALLALFLQHSFKSSLFCQVDFKQSDLGFVLFFMVEVMFFDELNLVVKLFAHFVLLLCADSG